ncbi:hypothetical protein EWH70_16310 [Amycolatopsis suaedae]|uniref:Mce-associated membrane protein n=1 Tax=Amycolatopsis suaedae TaxID=2510978 RepID=A0A4Q7J7W1_9PSEU|nr:hypothetical protein EWH70_16310 [Amycolatopsis suaedae]
MLAVLAALAVAAAAWTGWSWWSASDDAELTVARERDAVVAAATEGLAVLNTMDHRRAQADVARWLEVTTGQLAKDLSGDRELHQRRATDTATVATATVNRTAVAELDPGAGTARLLAVVDVRLSTRGAPPADTRSRLDVQLNRTESGWKVSAVQSAG